MLARRYVKAIIKELHGVWELRITYSYYSLYEYVDSFICRSLKEAKNRLILERCPEITVVGCDGHLIQLDGEDVSDEAKAPDQ
jgi:hypothetical protein